jgi:hypothetical protein
MACGLCASLGTRALQAQVPASAPAAPATPASEAAPPVLPAAVQCLAPPQPAQPPLACSAVAAEAKPKLEAPQIFADIDDPRWFGDTGGLIYLRDSHDFLRLYPHAQLALEAHGFFGSRVTTLSGDRAGVDLGPRFFVRHARFELAGEVLERLTFDAAFDLRANSAIDGARADGRKTRVALDDAWGYVDAGRGLGLMLGVFQAPFSLENQTETQNLAFMERSVATRGFAVPAPKVLGAALVGSTLRHVVSWSVGAFGGEAITPGDFTRTFDVIGRFGWDSTIQPRGVHLGISGRVGTRNPRDTSSDASAITTRQGFALWSPIRLDANGDRVRVQQTGNQFGLGVELRVVTPFLSLRSEGYYVSRDTREALDGAAGAGETSAAVAERGGRLHGAAGYVELSTWPLMALSILETEQPKLGQYPHQTHLELARTVPFRDCYGLELAALAGGILADYAAASRSGTPDPSAPGQHIQVIELGLALNYWHTARFKLGLNYSHYLTPHSGSARNLAAVPANLGPPEATLSSEHGLSELAARATLMF